MPSFVWIGDEDPAQQVITHHGLRWVKGEPVEVEDKAVIAKLKKNAMFSESEDDVIESPEPPAPDPEEGTEREAVKRALDDASIKYDGRLTLPKLRDLLASKTAESEA